MNFRFKKLFVGSRAFFLAVFKWKLSDLLLVSFLMVTICVNFFQWNFLIFSIALFSATMLIYCKLYFQGFSEGLFIQHHQHILIRFKAENPTNRCRTNSAVPRTSLTERCYQYKFFLSLVCQF